MIIALHEDQNMPVYGQVAYKTGGVATKGFKSWLAAVRWMNKWQRERNDYNEIGIAKRSACIHV